ncbi:outer membrane lipid asymmetry maintenance protein MlaD [Sneathiella sp. HT1-7]|jgi:phospholipid/cholesterol/gamma-HCH transport system substrate-binding protein|uniref:outer membrane lipid asymmetry maintenance protein MlaD n=1 Tax=Sneathiella sp. HT1-7 TaxID=2887192 RepID=UPI001D140003|nr:outer membrane lipid asymmetry maintenance protein MlaD [Sneathiella sp. HT1-7]MCC3305961.1 outer membrane lipid asymmetry maintenance protein MlaD [Sneathiella sp. HT1-7]
MSSNIVETVIGAVVLAFATIFLVFAYRTADVNTGSGGINLSASFDNVDGLSVGSDVRMSGIKVGAVTSQTLDPKNYRAILKISLEENIDLPDDSSAKITSSSLLGSNYLQLTPGGSEDMLKDGGTISYTQGAVNIQDLIAQAIFSSGSSDKKK